MNDIDRGQIKSSQMSGYDQQNPQLLQRSVLRTEGLVKRYGKRTVADKVTINVKSLDCLVLTGQVKQLLFI